MFTDESTLRVERFTLFPASGILPTRDRPTIALRTLQSLQSQSFFPAEIIVVDASTDDRTHRVVSELAASVAGSGCRVVWQSAERLGAAAQRNQGVAAATQPFVLFFDDDVLFEPECMARLWRAMECDRQLGGVSAMITNQRYASPGAFSRTLFAIMAGEYRSSYAGRILGPGINLLPEDSEDLPDVTTVDWLNLGATLYRREALPNPPFAEYFTGYSLGEDLALSLTVGRSWKLANARTARLFHDSQSGSHKSNPAALAEMELVNRHYIMTKILQRTGVTHYAKLALWEVMQVAILLLQSRNGNLFWRTVKGKSRGVGAIMRELRRSHSTATGDRVGES